MHFLNGVWQNCNVGLFLSRNLIQSLSQQKDWLCQNETKQILFVVKMVMIFHKGEKFMCSVVEL